MNKQENSSQSSIKFNLKALIVLVLFAVGLYFLLPKLINAPQAIKLVLGVKKPLLLIALGFEMLSYVGSATLLGIILSRLGYRLKFWDRFRIGSIGAFAIHFFPVGTFGEGAADFYFLRKKKVEAGSILLTLVLRILISYTAFLLIFLVGLILVPTAPYLPFSPKIISLFLFLLVLVGTFYMIYLYNHKDKFRKTWNRFLRFFDIFVSRIRGKEVSQQAESEIFEDIYSGIGLFGRKKRFAVMAIFASLLYWLSDIACFYSVFLSLGYHIHPGVLIFGYGVASLAGMISFIPGGLGITEGTMGLIYSGLGVSSSLAITAILIFRLFSFWMLIPFGLYSYLSLSKEKNS